MSDGAQAECGVVVPHGRTPCRGQAVPDMRHAVPAHTRLPRAADPSTGRGRCAERRNTSVDGAFPFVEGGSGAPRVRPASSPPATGFYREATTDRINYSVDVCGDVMKRVWLRRMLRGLRRFTHPPVSDNCQKRFPKRLTVSFLYALLRRGKIFRYRSIMPFGCDSSFGYLGGLNSIENKILFLYRRIYSLLSLLYYFFFTLKK